MTPIPATPNPRTPNVINLRTASYENCLRDRICSLCHRTFGSNPYKPILAHGNVHHIHLICFADSLRDTPNPHCPECEEVIVQIDGQEINTATRESIYSTAARADAIANTLWLMQQANSPESCMTHALLTCCEIM